MIEEPQSNFLRKVLTFYSLTLWNNLQRLTYDAMEWWQTRTPQQKKLLKGIGVSIVLIVVILAVWKIPERQLAPLKAKIQRERNHLPTQDRLKLEHDARKLETDARTALLQAVGGLALLIGLYFTAKTWRTTQEGQITDRFTKAINQLGETGPERLAIRLGGIYALERIARDSERDYWPIMEVITAYVRENVPWKEEEQRSKEKRFPSDPQPLQNKQPPPKLATDIRAILTVLRRRHPSVEDEGLDLAYTALRGADLRDAYLKYANLQEVHLEGALLSSAELFSANLQEAHLERADLVGAQMMGANLQGAHLEEADLGAANLRNANVQGAHLQGANLVIADLSNANFRGAYLEGAKNLTVEQLATVETLYDAHLDPRLLEHIYHHYPHLREEPQY